MSILKHLHEAKKSIKIIIDKYKIPKDNICQVLARDEDEKEIDDDSSEEEESISKKKHLELVN